MSQENVDFVRSICAAFVKGDFEQALAGLHPEIEWRGTIGGIEEGRVFRGHHEVIEAYLDSQQAWDSHFLEAQRFIDVGDRVLVFWHERARGRSSHVEVTTDTAVIYTVRDCCIVAVQPYMEQAEALRAVGLTE